MKNKAILLTLSFLISALLSATAWAGGTASAPDVSASEDTGLFARVETEPWRFRLIPFGWAPSNINFHVKDGPVNEHLNLSLDDLAGAIKGIAELQGEVRKGPIGGFVSMMYLQLNGNTGNLIKIDANDQVYFWNYGLTYEAGRWNLGDAPGSPSVKVEPFVGGRTLRDSIRLNTFGRTKNVELEFTVPVAGVKTYWDLDKHWNLALAGDYGGFDVDGVNETWMVTGVVGYRFDIRGHPANVMAGYRTLFIDYEEDGAELDINAHGPIFGLAIDF